MDSIGRFFTNLSLAGSDSLEALIATELARVGPLQNYVGQSVAGALTEVLQESVTTVIGRRVEPIPADLVLHQNYPNPFNPATTIKYRVFNNAEVKLEIFNLLGEQVATLVDKQHPAGYYSTVWNGKDGAGEPVASGIYLYRLRTGRFVQVKKLTLLR